MPKTLSDKFKDRVCSTCHKSKNFVWEGIGSKFGEWTSLCKDCAMNFLEKTENERRTQENIGT